MSKLERPYVECDFICSVCGDPFVAERAPILVHSGWGWEPDIIEDKRCPDCRGESAEPNTTLDVFQYLQKRSRTLRPTLSRREEI